MNPRFEMRFVRLEAFGDSEETFSEPLRDCWVYLFWYTLRREGGFTVEAYVDDEGKYHEIDLVKHFQKSVRPHAKRGEDGLLLPTSNRRGQESTTIFHVPIVSPFQIPASRLPKIPFDQTATAENLFFETLHDWLAKERDILGASFIAESMVKEGRTWVARLQTPWHRAVCLARDLSAAQSRLIAELKANPNQARVLCVHKAVESLLASGRDESLIDRARFRDDRGPLERFEKRQEVCDAAGDALLRHVDRLPFGAMVDDMNAAATADAYSRFMVGLEPVFDMLPAVPRAQAYLGKFFRKSKGILTDKNYKAARKGGKAVWAFFKAAIKVTTDKDHFKRLRPWIVEWADFMNVSLHVDDRGLIAPAFMKRFEERVVDHHRAHKVWMLVDGFNLGIAVADVLAEGEFGGAKAFSAGSAALSVFGTAAGWRESLAKKAEKAGKEATWKVLKNVAGVGNNVADAVASGIQGLDELDSDDFDAAVAQFVNVAGGTTQVIGYAMAVCGAASVATVVIFAGAALVAGGTIYYLLADNDDIDDWLTHCWYGRARNEQTKGSKKWSEGPLHSFHTDPDRQLRALNRILFNLQVSWEYLRALPPFGRQRSAVRLRVTSGRLPKGSAIRVKITARVDGTEHTIHHEQPWRPRDVQTDSRGNVTMSEEMDLCMYDEVRVEARLDIYANGVHFIPPAHEPPLVDVLKIDLIDRVRTRQDPVPA